MKFDIVKEDPQSSARAGVLHTDHGDIPTPIFMPVGTVGSVKAVHQRELREDIDAKIILGNTYHLYLRPGLDILKAAGGLHGFNGWERPLLTDSGGFQVFSLADNRKIKEEGCTFRSHIDGSKHLFTPEGVMDIQRVIGADIIMAFDECAPGEADYRYAKRSMELTHRWLDRCVQRFGDTEPLYGYQQSLFPIVQGCKYPDLRRQSAEYIASKGADGNAIGGLAVGEPTETMYEMVELVNAILPKDKPRYLMGVGTPTNILECVERGVDMFDCVMPHVTVATDCSSRPTAPSTSRTRSGRAASTPSTPRARRSATAFIPSPISTTSSMPRKFWAFKSAPSTTSPSISGWSARHASTSLPATTPLGNRPYCRNSQKEYND